MINPPPDFKPWSSFPFFHSFQRSQRVCTHENSMVFFVAPYSTQSSRWSRASERVGHLPAKFRAPGMWTESCSSPVLITRYDINVSSSSAMSGIRATLELEDRGSTRCLQCQVTLEMCSQATQICIVILRTATPYSIWKTKAEPVRLINDASGV